MAMIAGGLAIIVLGFDLDTGSATPGLGNLVDYGGFVPNGGVGLLASLAVVMFAFGGIETIGVSAGEAENPGRSIPSAINTVPVRILLFYVLTIGILMSLVPWNEITGETSPFVQIFDSLGMPLAAHILNAVVITAALSAVNSDTFGAGRVLLGLPEQGHAPSVFGRISRSGVPWMRVVLITGVLLAGVVLNAAIPQEVFLLIASIATFATV